MLKCNMSSQSTAPVVKDFNPVKHAGIVHGGGLEDTQEYREFESPKRTCECIVSCSLCVCVFVFVCLFVEPLHACATNRRVAPSY